MGKILTKEVGEHYKLLESDFQSSYILEKMLNSFKGKESKWYSSEKGKQMLQAGGKKMESLRVTALSINYQEHLNYTIEFNENEIQLRDGQQTKSVSGQFKQQPSSNGLPESVCQFAVEVPIGDWRPHLPHGRRI